MTKDNWTDQGFAAGWDESGNVKTNPDRHNQLSLLADMVSANKVKHLLDLGIGSAQVEITLHNRHTEFFAGCEVTGVDHSAAMLKLAAERCSAESLNNVHLVERDFRTLGDFVPDNTPDAVICVQALHEVPHDVKHLVFHKVRQWLPDHQPFYILDRFKYPAENWFEDWDAIWSWMRSRVSEEVLDFDSYHQQYSAKDDHIATVQDYREWLEDAGFKTLCPYQCFNRALIVART